MENCLTARNISHHWQANVILVISSYKDARKCRSSSPSEEFNIHSIELTFPAKCMIGLVLFFVMSCLLSTFVTIYKNYCMGAGSLLSKDQQLLKRDEVKNDSWRSRVGQILNCFCLITNGRRLLSTTVADGQVRCIDGMRVLVMLWIFLGHLCAVLVLATRNIKEHEKELSIAAFQFLYNFNLVVDVNFLISGYLCARNVFQETSASNGKLNLCRHYMRRFMRLTPVYMIVLGTYTFMFPFVGSGSLWPLYSANPLCRDNWWKNLIYVNNLFPASEMCMDWSWYSAADMQFFVIAPVMLISLMRSPRIGYAFMALLSGVTVVFNFALKYYFDVLVSLEQIITDWDAFVVKVVHYYDVAYIKPYARICPYIIGIALAYYAHKTKGNERIRMKSFRMGWSFCVLGLAYCFFGRWYEEPSLLAESIHTGLKHLVFPSSLAWVIFACSTGYGGGINKFLSWKAFVPLSRLTYCVYLVHCPIMFYFFFRLEELLDFSFLYTGYFFFLGTFLIFAVGFVVAIIFELPISRIWNMSNKKKREVKEKHL